jgi:hypothetical protein
MAVEYKVEKGIGRLVSSKCAYIKNGILSIHAPDCVSLNVNGNGYKLNLGYVDVIVKSGPIYISGCMKDGTIVPFESLIVASGVKDFETSLLVTLQANGVYDRMDAIDKKLSELLSRVDVMEKKMPIVDACMAKVNETVGEFNKLEKRVEELEANYDPTVIK